MAAAHSSTIRRSSYFSDLARPLGQPDDVVEAARPEEEAHRGVEESEDGTGLFGRRTDHPKAVHPSNRSPFQVKQNYRAEKKDLYMVGSSCARIATHVL